MNLLSHQAQKTNIGTEKAAKAGATTGSKNNNSNMKYSKLNLLFSGIPIIVTLLWVLLGMYVFSMTDRRNYSSIFLLIDLATIIIGCYYSIKALKEKNSIYKIAGISLSCMYVLGILFLIVMNMLDFYRFMKS